MSNQESINGQLKLLTTLRSKLRYQIEQRGKIGSLAPAYMQLDIDEDQAHVKQIKAYLRRNNVEVTDEPEDGLDLKTPAIDQPSPITEPVQRESTTTPTNSSSVEQSLKML